MASGSFNLTRTGDTSSYVSFKCEWSSKSNGSIANSSTVTVKIIATKSSSSTSNTWGTHKTTAEVNNSSKSSSGSFTLKPGGSITLLSKSYTVPHNSDGTKTTTIEVSVGGDVMWGNGSAKITLDKIPRASSVSGGSGNIGMTSIINIESAISSFTHTLEYAFGNLTGIIAENVETSYTWTIPISFYAEMPNENTSIGVITCHTYDGDTLIGSTMCTFTAKVTDSNPIIGDFGYNDSNAETVLITQNEQRIIRNNSNLVFYIGVATPQNAAAISNYEVTFNEITKSITSPGNLDFGIVNLSSDTTATLKVTDSRGNTTVKEITVVIDDWILPTALITLNRKNNFYSETEIKVDVTYSSLNDKNIIGIQYQCKKIDEDNFTITGELEDNVLSTIELDNEYQWYIEIILTDLIGKTKYSLNLDRGMPIIFFDRLKSSVGFNQFPTGEKSVEISGSIMNDGKALLDIIHPIGCTYITESNTDPANILGFGKWELYDKEFKPQYLSADEGIFTHNTTNVSESSAVAVFGGHTVRVRITAVNKVALSDTNKELGTINLDKIGVQNLIYTETFNASCSDDTSVARVSVTHNTGLVTHLGTIGGTSIAVGETINIDFTVPMIAERMLNEFCDKFYWKRTA